MYSRPYAGQDLFRESEPGRPYCGRVPVGDKRQRARRRGDGQRGNASVLTKGMNPADRLAGDASASLTGRHPLIGDLPRQLNNQTLDGPSFESQRLGPPPRGAGRRAEGLAVHSGVGVNADDAVAGSVSVLVVDAEMWVAL